MTDRTNNKFIALLLIFLLLSSHASYLAASGSDALAEKAGIPNAGTNKPCECVVFRMDDVNSRILEDVQLDVMDEFISKNQSVSLGLVMHEVDPGSPIAGEINEGMRKGLFELDIHGWDHVDYTRLSLEKQLETLRLADDKLHGMFGRYSTVFIPPYNKFDNDTIGVMRQIGVKIISADTSNDVAYRQSGENAAGSDSALYHLPAMVSFKNDNGNGTWVKVPISDVLTIIDRDIGMYGYSVVLLHPQNFARMQNGIFTDSVDNNEVEDLSHLIDAIESKNLRITTFADVVGLDHAAVPPSYTYVIPEFQGMGPVMLALSIFALLALLAVGKKRSLILK